MLATLLSATILGLDGRVIRVEVDVAPGLPGFTIVGLADASLREARERVRGAIRNSGLVHPPRRITVNLAPAELPKAGASLDLAIALGILVGSEQLRPAAGVTACIGELSLGGEVRAVPGTLPMVAALARAGLPRVLVPASASAEARLVPGIEVVAVATLADAVERLRRRPRPSPVAPERVDLASGPGVEGPRGGAIRADATPYASGHPDLADVRGQAEARRALEVALAGGHGLLLIGPPGAGKTLLARAIPGLLPDLGDREALAATVVASVSGEGPLGALVRRPPFRAPHHTASHAAMVGGGPGPRPGEVTRADHGVLFLDELPEFARDVLEALRVPLEDGRVEIARAGGAVTLPARFQLVAAMNPCPCGFAGTPRCECPTGVPDRYLRRVSGPLRDRIDLCVGMPAIPASALLAAAVPEDSATVGARIAAARVRQAERHGGRLNARVTGRELRSAARLTARATAHLAAIAGRDALSGRGTERLLRVARTVADLEGADAVSTDHLDEAARWRVPVGRSLRDLAA